MPEISHNVSSTAATHLMSEHLIQLLFCHRQPLAICAVNHKDDKLKGSRKHQINELPKQQNPRPSSRTRALSLSETTKRYGSRTRKSSHPDQQQMPFQGTVYFFALYAFKTCVENKFGELTLDANEFLPVLVKNHYLVRMVSLSS